jgi:hypothetical protein
MWVQKWRFQILPRRAAKPTLGAIFLFRINVILHMSVTFLYRWTFKCLTSAAQDKTGGLPHQTLAAHSSSVHSQFRRHSGHESRACSSNAPAGTLPQNQSEFLEAHTSHSPLSGTSISAATRRRRSATTSRGACRGGNRATPRGAAPCRCSLPSRARPRRRRAPSRRSRRRRARGRRRGRGARTRRPACQSNPASAPYGGAAPTCR